MGLETVPVRRTWRLNERHYGALQGLGWWQAVRTYGPVSVIRCKRHFAVRPPALDPDDARFPGKDPRYAELSAAELPRTESLEDTLGRLRPCWEEEVAPALRRGDRVLLVSHHNTLRALVKLLDGLPDADTARLKIPTGQPLVYRFDRDLRPLRLPPLEFPPGEVDTLRSASARPMGAKSRA
jgi:2,3-bisphosphoglycerate-dependent phosphoglycerate mutase